MGQCLKRQRSENFYFFGLALEGFLEEGIFPGAVSLVRTGLSLRPADWSVYVSVGTGVCWAWDRRLGDVTAGPPLILLQVHCGQLSDSEEWSLQAVEKHTLVALRRVQALQQRGPGAASEAVQNPLAGAAGDQKGGVAYTDQDRKILQLCGELYDLDASSLQLKVLQYLQQETQASRCCLLLVSEDNLQLSCKVIGDKVLEEETSFPLTTGRLGHVVEDKKSIQLKDLTSDDVQQLQSMLGCELQAMLCVPVISRATDQVVALACAFNKLGGGLFTDQDERVIQHCFHYTSTVLTSTLAFQKEQKLKCECQVSHLL